MQHKKFEDFDIVEQLTSEQSTASFRHTVLKIKKRPAADSDAQTRTKKKFQYNWYAKEVKSYLNAYRELVAQEFLRLFYPHQPKTRIAVSENGKIYILSKEVPGFTPVRIHREEQAIQNGTLAGLGILLILALLINEIDLKSGNLGKDQHGHFIKIDGDNCLIRLLQHCAQFTAIDIANLPFIKDYYAYNWLDIIREAKAITSRLSSNLNKSPLLRKEINETILAALLLHNLFIKQFVNFYVLDASIADQIFVELASNRQALFSGILANKDFLDFYHITDMNVFINKLSVQFATFLGISKFSPFTGINISDLMTQEASSIAPWFTNRANYYVEQNATTVAEENASKKRVHSTPPQTHILRNYALQFIYENCNGTLEDVAQFFRVNKGTLTKHLKELYKTTFTELKNLSKEKFEAKFEETRNKIGWELYDENKTNKKIKWVTTTVNTAPPTQPPVPITTPVPPPAQTPAKLFDFSINTILNDPSPSAPHLQPQKTTKENERRPTFTDFANGIPSLPLPTPLINHPHGLFYKENATSFSKEAGQEEDWFSKILNQDGISKLCKRP